MTKQRRRLHLTTRRILGWDERALHDAVMICGLFSFMNRVVQGLGLRANEEYSLQAAAGLSKEGYAALLPHLGDG